MYVSPLIAARLSSPSWLIPKTESGQHRSPQPISARARDARIGLSALALLLSACTSTVTVTCPAPVVYSPGMQAEAADELLALPPGSILTQMMIDYGQLRAKLRECQ
jgi:hypothetical protein